MIVNQSSHVKVLMEGIKSQTMSIAVKDNLIAQQTQQIEALTTENQRLNTENTNLTTQNQQLTDTNTNLTDENLKLRANSIAHAPLNNDSLECPGTTYNKSVKNKIPLSKDALGHKWDPLTGMKHTFGSPLPFVLKREKKEEMIKDFYNGDWLISRDRIERWIAKDKTLVDCMGMPDTPWSIALDIRDKTPLMLAAGKGNLQNVKFLVENNADVNYVDRSKSTALDYANSFWSSDKINRSLEVYDYLKNERHAFSGGDYEIVPDGKTQSK
jgi:hypothetical protein